MAPTEPVHFFDITSTLPGALKSWSPNTLRTRMALNYKQIPYKQSFISYPDIAPLLKSMAVTPHHAGMQYTLPAIVHKPTVTSNQPSGALMDSMAIALHLETAFPAPDYPTLFPSGDASYALTLAVGRVLGCVLDHMRDVVMPGVAEILDERGKEYFIETRSKMFGKPLGRLRPTDAEILRKKEEAAVKELGVLVSLLKGRPGKSGVFLEGKNPGYADFYIVTFLAWFERVDKSLWEKMVAIGDGEIRALWEACLPWLNDQGETVECQIPK